MNPERYLYLGKRVHKVIMRKVLNMVFYRTVDNVNVKEEVAKERPAERTSQARQIVLLRAGQLNRLSFFAATIKDNILASRLILFEACFFVQTCARCYFKMYS
jgi:hypothetical protein